MNLNSRFLCLCSNNLKNKITRYHARSNTPLLFVLKKQILSEMNKRIFDILFSICVLLSLLPLYILIGMLIKCFSKGAIFYASERVGKHGRLIKCWKFRTMEEHAELNLAELLSSYPFLKKEWNQFGKLKNDPRITSFGKILRKLSLDELPQFWNVLRGDLSIVGPRPYLEDQMRNCCKAQREKILSIRPGITGIWQTSGRNIFTLKERIFIEEHYVNHSNFFLDLRLIFKTIFVILFPRGVY